MNDHQGTEQNDGNEPNQSNVFSRWPWNAHVPYARTLYVFVMEQMWENALDRARSDPVEIAYVDMNRYTALHIACQGDTPIDVLKALVEAYARCAPVVTMTVETPLHLAVRGNITRTAAACSIEAVKILLEGIGEKQATSARYRGAAPIHTACLEGASVEIVRVLLQANPESVSFRDNDGNTPLLCAIASATRTQRQTPTYEVLTLLLETCPDAAKMANYRGVKPLELLMEACCHSEIPRINPLLSTAEGGVLSRLPPEITLFWNKVRVLMCAMDRGNVTDVDTPNFKCLHAATSLGSNIPMQLYGMATKIHADEAMEKDKHGRLPLTIAAASSLQGIQCRYVVDCLLNVNPRAASVLDASGRLPLSLAVLSGKAWERGVKSLADAAPQALVTRDIETHMYPFMLAAAAVNAPETYSSVLTNEESSSERDLISLSNTFHLLSEAPELLAALSFEKELVS